MVTLEGQEVAKHNSRASCWIVIDGTVWDVTNFVKVHPGGASIIFKLAGHDATEEYTTYHPPYLVTETLGPAAIRGQVDPATLPQLERKPDIEAQKKEAPPLSSLINLHDFEAVAEKFLPPTAWAYYSAGADDEISTRENARAYQKVFLRPRILRNVGVVDSSTSMLGKRCSFPVYMSPSGLAKLAHPLGECAIASAVGKEGLVQVVNTHSSMPIEAIMEARVSKDQPVFWQFYVDRDLEKSKAFVQRVEKVGVSAIWLTVDSPVVGKRERDDRSQAKVHMADQKDILIEAPMSQDIAKAASGSINPSIDWSILEWLRGVTSLPIVIKGIQSVEDAVLAHRSGVQGIVLSNHGGRSQDTAQPPLLTLLEIRKYAPHLLDCGMEIYIDGGIRRGTDVIKALALGATAVGLGRPFLYSLCAGYGERGVRRMVQILRDEFQTNMALVGAANVKELSHYMVNTKRLERDLIGSVKL